MHSIDSRASVSRSRLPTSLCRAENFGKKVGRYRNPSPPILVASLHDPVTPIVQLSLSEGRCRRRYPRMRMPVLQICSASAYRDRDERPTTSYFVSAFPPFVVSEPFPLVGLCGTWSFGFHSSNALAIREFALFSFACRFLLMENICCYR